MQHDHSLFCHLIQGVEQQLHGCLEVGTLVVFGGNEEEERGALRVVGALQREGRREEGGGREGWRNGGERDWHRNWQRKSLLYSNHGHAVKTT